MLQLPKYKNSVTAFHQPRAITQMSRGEYGLDLFSSLLAENIVFIKGVIDAETTLNLVSVFIAVYLPMQKVEKIWFKISSVSVSPVTSPSEESALRNLSRMISSNSP